MAALRKAREVVSEYPQHRPNRFDKANKVPRGGPFGPPRKKVAPRPIPAGVDVPGSARPRAQPSAIGEPRVGPGNVVML